MNLFTCPSCGSHEKGIENDTEVCSRCYGYFKQSNHTLLEEWLATYLKHKASGECKPKTAEQKRLIRERRKAKKDKYHKLNVLLNQIITYAASVVFNKVATSLLTDEVYNRTEDKAVFIEAVYSYLYTNSIYTLEPPKIFAEYLWTIVNTPNKGIK